MDYPITLVPKSNNKFEVVLPEDGHSRNLYSYETEGFTTVDPYDRPDNRTIEIGEWFTAPNLRFRLVKNPIIQKIDLQNIIVKLSTVNNAVQDIVSTIGVDFDKEIGTIMIITKEGITLMEP